MYLKKWTPNFNLENNVPLVVLVWVYIQHIHLHYWNDDALKCIGNYPGHYIDKEGLNENMFSSAIICFGVDLEKGIPEVVLISLDNW